MAGGVNALFGLRHRDFKYICFHPIMKHGTGLEEGRKRPRNKKFGRGVVSREFDTLYLIDNASIFFDYKMELEYELEIIDAKGTVHTTLRKIPPQGYDVFWLSELLEEMEITSVSPYYMLWSNTLGKGFHSLYRRRDHALNLIDTFKGTFSKEKLTPQAPETKLSLKKIKKYIPTLLKKPLRRLFYFLISED